ncbi:lactonase family protein [Paraburkholderia tropica]|uniref:lactonase family protein n=1 Tax=Paraburkholderia tropica TaxID=92647 RepID=UPI001591B074|nr:lactonase family protein [Paraburkholderia tropica]
MSAVRLALRFTVAISCAFTLNSARASSFVYVSNANSNEIIGFSLNEDTGALTRIQTEGLGGKVMPLAISPNQLRLYAVVRTEPYRVASLAINPIDGHLTNLGSAPLAQSMAYISTDQTGRFLLSASYGGNVVSLNPIDSNGVVGAPSDVEKTGPMAHAIRPSPDNRYVFASVLGADQWLRFQLDADAGKLIPDPAPAFQFPKHSGPRHFVFSKDARHVYLIDETDGKLHMLAFDSKADAVRLVQSVSTLPPESEGQKVEGADLHLTDDGRFLYTSDRASSTISAFRVDAATGRLSRVGTYPTVKNPRGFNVAGKFVIVAGLESPDLQVFAIDRKSGSLIALEKYPVGKGANWVETVKFDGSNH